MKWRVAKSLLQLRDQVNARFPDRDKSWDGTIGDTAHSSRKSDHNPNEAGVVCAMDITHDPDNGVDSYKMAEQLRQGRDGRIKYVISNGRIFSSTQSPWAWRRYSGSNPHDHHVHVSVKSPAKYYDDPAPWELPMLMASIMTSEVASADDEEVGDEEVAPHRSVANTIETVSDTVGAVTSLSAKAKPLYKSHISWASVGLGASGVASAASAAPPTLLEQFINIWKSPIWWLVVFNVLLTGYILYHYWVDHGRGARR